MAEAQDLLDKQDVQIEESAEEKRILSIKLNALQAENLGATAAEAAKDVKSDNLSQKTGIMSQATKFTENEDIASNANFNFLAQQEKVTIDFLRK